MELCSKCKKRPAVVFVSHTTDSSDTVGYCLTCAKEMGIKPVTDIMEKMGISEEELENMQNQMSDLMQSGMIPQDLNDLFDSDDPDAPASNGNDEEEEEDGDFSRGGAPAFPSFFNNLFSGGKNADAADRQS